MDWMSFTESQWASFTEANWSTFPEVGSSGVAAAASDISTDFPQITGHMRHLSIGAL